MNRIDIIDSKKDVLECIGVYIPSNGRKNIEDKISISGQQLYEIFKNFCEFSITKS